MSNHNCVCGMADKGFMIFCDNCEHWYHGQCVGENKKSARSKKDWFCRSCKAACKQFDKLQVRISSLQNELNALKQSVSDVESKVSNVTKENNLSDSSANLTSCSEVSALKNELAKAAEERGHLLNKCSSMEKTIATFENTIKTSTEEVSVLKNELAKVAEERDQLFSKCSHMEEFQVSVLQNELSKVREERNCFQVKYESLREENQKMKAALQMKRKSRLSLSQGK